MPPLRIGVALLLTLGLMLSGCDLFSEGPGELPLELRTDRTAYSRADSGTVQIVGLNASFEVLYQVCPSFDTVLEKRQDASWRSLGPWYLTVAGGARPCKIAPGTTVDFIDLPVSSNVIEGPGTYRIRTKVYASKKLSHSQRRVSNSFQIR